MNHALLVQTLIDLRTQLTLRAVVTVEKRECVALACDDTEAQVLADRIGSALADLARASSPSVAPSAPFTAGSRKCDHCGKSAAYLWPYLDTGLYVHIDCGYQRAAEEKRATAPKVTRIPVDLVETKLVDSHDTPSGAPIVATIHGPHSLGRALPGAAVLEIVGPPPRK